MIVIKTEEERKDEAGKGLEEGEKRQAVKKRSEERQTIRKELMPERAERKTTEKGLGIKSEKEAGTDKGAKKDKEQVKSEETNQRAGARRGSVPVEREASEAMQSKSEPVEWEAAEAMQSKSEPVEQKAAEATQRDTGPVRRQEDIEEREALQRETVTAKREKAAEEVSQRKAATARKLLFYLNDSLLSLPPKEDKSPYYLMDMIEYSGIDLKNPQGNIRLTVNGKQAMFQQALAEGDRIEIRVEERGR